MASYEKQLNELYLMPLGLSLYGEIHDIDMEIPSTTEIFSSPKIEEIIRNRTEKSNILEPIKNTVYKALEKRKLIVGYVNKSKFNFFYKRLIGRTRTGLTTGLGFYDYPDDTIFVLLDKNVNIFGKDITSIDGVISHEFCHMAARHFKKTNFFKELNKPFIYPYYLAFLRFLYRNMFNISKNDYETWINKENTKKAVIKLLNNLHSNENILNKKRRIGDNLNYWFNFFKESSNDFLSKEESLIYARIIVDTYISTIMTESYDYEEVNKIRRYLLESYKKIGMTRYPMSFTGQELIMTSEIVCISNQNGIANSVARCINKIPM